MINERLLEESSKINNIAQNNKLDIINLISQNSSEERIQKICQNSSGFIYLVSILGITGTKEPDISKNIPFINHIRKNSDLPIALGFGIKNPEIAGRVAKLDIDAVVVGSSLVEIINNNILDRDNILKEVSAKVKGFKTAIN